MHEPVNVKGCLHKFCSKCINDYIRIEKKECPTCRTSIGSRRLLRKDEKLKKIIEYLLPDIESFRQYEQEDVNRNIKALNKSEEHIKKMAEMQKIKERQLRNEQEERKEQQKVVRPKVPPARKPEPKPRITRERSPLNDKSYRPQKRQKVEEKRPMNIEFKLKEVPRDMLSAPRPGERVLQKIILHTNDQIQLKHLTKFILNKLESQNMNSNTNIVFLVRQKENKAKLEKIGSYETSIKDLLGSYWNNEPLNSLYFSI